MTKSTAFWRLFPALLFSLLGVILSVLWRSDPVLMAMGACAASAAVAWLIITTVEVAKMLWIDPAPAAGVSAAESTPAH